MLSTSSVENVVVGWSWTPGPASRASERREDAWRDLDRQLRSVAKRRAALDHEELTLIREAIRMQLWRPLGMTSMREYLESRMGYGPQVAAERLRVAEALDALPAIDEALRANRLSYSAVRELTRIATRKTEQAWVAACEGKNLRQIEELVAEREPGDAPTSKPKPDLRPRKIPFDLRPATIAHLREARAKLEAERGERLDDDELIDALCLRAIEESPPQGGKATRPRYQIRVTVCRACGQGWQNGAGREIAVPAADVACASCDSDHVDDRGRVTSEIPAATRKLVFRRDEHRCTVPGCRSAQSLDVHHLVHRAHGGTHDLENLTLLCAGHHRAHHDGLLAITGRAPAIEVRWLAEVPRDPGRELGEQPKPAAYAASSSRPTTRPKSVPHVEVENDSVDDTSAAPSHHEWETGIPELARSALRNLGFSRGEAKVYVARAIAIVGSTQIEPLIRAALREYRRRAG